MLAELRKASGVSIGDLVKATGGSASTVKRWLRGIRLPGKQEQANLAGAFGIGADELADRLGQATSNSTDTTTETGEGAR